MTAPAGSARFRIVVATHRRAADLARLLEALVPQLDCHPDTRLVVVNDASHDASYEALMDRFAGRLEYRVLTENLGPGRARHHGIADAAEDYLILTDDDCRPGPRWLDWVKAHVAAHPATDLFAGTTVSDLEEGAGVYRRLLNLPQTYPMAHQTQFGLLTAVTACCVIRREAYVAAGGFPEAIRGATEDCWLTQAIIAAGGSYMITDAIRTRHKANTSLREMRRRWRGYGRGGAFTAVMQPNWKLALTGSDGTLAGVLHTIRVRCEPVARYNRERGLGLVTRWSALAIFTLLMLEYELAWRAELRRIARAGKGALPGLPRLDDRYAPDFAGTTAAPARDEAPTGHA